MATPNEVSLVEVMLRLLLVLVVWGAVVSAGAVWIQRRYGRRAAWLTAAAIVLSVTTAGTVAFQQSFQGAESPAVTAVMIALFVGSPIAAVNLAVGWRRELLEQSSFRHVLRGWIAFMASLPLAFVLGALPDIVRAF